MRARFATLLIKMHSLNVRGYPRGLFSYAQKMQSPFATELTGH
jgi:hypothetical protein